jgi:glycosyltransferase involved in cell wall biosynthesis
VTTVSIAMATFNGAAYLGAQLRSLIDQSRRPDEVVVCDDASTDGTVDQCESVLHGSGIELVVLQNAVNLGPYASFSRALCATRGDHVFLCDQDDVWYPTKIARVSAILASRPEVSSVVHDVDICTGDLTPIGQTKFERMRRLGLPLAENVTGMSTATRRAVVDAAFPLSDPLATSHDAWLHWVADHMGERHVLNVALAAFRRHDDNVTKDLLVNRGVRVTGRPPLYRFRQLVAAWDVDRRLDQAHRFATLQETWLHRAQTTELVPRARIAESFERVRARQHAIDVIAAVASTALPSRWLRAAGRWSELRRYAAMLGPSLVVGPVVYGSRSGGQRDRPRRSA